MEYFICPFCEEKIRITTEGLQHSGSNPFHLFRYSKSEIEFLKDLNENESNLIYNIKNKFHSIENSIKDNI